MKKIVMFFVLLVVIMDVSVSQSGFLGAHHSDEAERLKFLSAAKRLSQLDSSFIVSDNLISFAPVFSPLGVTKIARSMDSILSSNGYQILSACTPNETIEDWRWAFQNIDPRIKSHAGLQTVPRYCLVLITDSNGTKLWLQDFLAEKFWRWSCPATINPVVATELLLTELMLDVPRVDLSNIKTEEYQYMVRLAQEPHDSVTQDLLYRLQIDGWKIKLSYGNHGGFSTVGTLELEPQQLAELGKIQLSRFACLNFTKPLGSLKSLMCLYDVLDTTDGYGNNVFRDKFNAAYDLSESIKYFVPFPLVDSTETVQLSFDLSFLGYADDLHGIFICQGIPKVAIDESWPYRLYGTDEAVAQLNSLETKEFLLGVADMESMFSYSLSEVVKKIFVTSDQIINAGFMDADQHSIYVHSQTLIGAKSVSWPKINARIVGRHEAIHAIAYALGLNEHRLVKMIYDDSTPFYNRFTWTSSPQSFCGQLDEERFDPDTAIFGGHSADSPAEFLASYFNSLVRDGWEEIMLKKSDEFRLQYAKVTQVMKNIFSKRDVLTKTPINDLLVDRLKWLKLNE